MPIRRGIRMHTTANEKAWVLVSEWVSEWVSDIGLNQRATASKNTKETSRTSYRRRRGSWLSRERHPSSVTPQSPASCPTVWPNLSGSDLLCQTSGSLLTSAWADSQDLSGLRALASSLLEAARACRDPSDGESPTRLPCLYHQVGGGSAGGDNH